MEAVLGSPAVNQCIHGKNLLPLFRLLLCYSGLRTCPKILGSMQYTDRSSLGVSNQPMPFRT